ncbi:MAG TPA: DUF1570 domain-containing protein [Tepidisphaeraceae bacterium]|nr:DUF1570 domain-containing protein [Tepidisphaeraceae bacterium]
MKEMKAFVLALCALSPLWMAATLRAQMRTLNTIHYRIHTDIEQRLAEDMAVRMEAMYGDYSQRLSNFSPPGDATFEVYLFKNQKDFSHLTDDRFPNTGGVFIKSRHLLAGFLDGQGRDALRRTLQHEAFHQFADTAISQRIPPWLNEGIAQVFEESIWTGRGFLVNQVPVRRIRQVQLDIRERRLEPFREFITMSDQKWLDSLKDAPIAAAHYSQAWAMCHFLIFSTDENNQYKYRSRFIDMLQQIHSGTRAVDAFTRAFSDNYEGFQSRFLEYVKALRPTAEATFFEYQGVLGDMMISAKSRGVRFTDGDEFRKFVTDGNVRLRYTKGDLQWTTDTDPSVYFRDIAGREMSGQQFYLSDRKGSPLPDIVCVPIPKLFYRTIFHDEGGKIEHETIVEAK